MHIPVSHGHLEALVKEPVGLARGAAVVCHPHPIHGGTMHTKAVYRAAQALNDAGLVTLRFNFRGVGASTGSFDEGIGEREDLEAALDWLEREYPTLPLFAGGFSFGSRISAGLALRQPRIQRLVLVATPVLAYPCEALAQLRTPGYLLMAGQDEFGTLAAVKSSFPKLATVLEMDEIAGAEHFFAGHVRELETKIETWARRELDD